MVKERGNEKGYVAIISVLVVGAVLLAIGVGVSYNAINEAMSSLSDRKKEAVLGHIDACIQDELLYLNNNNNVKLSITLPTGTCSVTLNSNVGSTWTFTVTGTVGGHTKNVQVTATRTSTVAVTSWLEI